MATAASANDNDDSGDDENEKNDNDGSDEKNELKIERLDVADSPIKLVCSDLKSLNVWKSNCKNTAWKTQRRRAIDRDIVDASFHNPYALFVRHARLARIHTMIHAALGLWIIAKRFLTN